MKAVRYLIVGNSVAGVSAIEAIRQVDPEGSLLVVSDEDVLNYSRPLISYLLGGKVTEDRMAFRDEAFYRSHKVELVLGKRAVGLDVKERRLTLEDGEVLGFEKLLVATGGKPVVPPIEGLSEVKEGVFTFTRLSDARAILEYLSRHGVGEAVVLGAGLIGLKATEGLVHRGLRVTIVELAPWILPNTLDRDASEVLERALLRWGCRVIKEDTIVRVEGRDGALEGVVLRSGQRIATRLLIVAIGVRPNLDLVEDTPINCDRGIVVDERMQTNIHGIYAAGDVAQGKDCLTSQNAVLAIWPVAARQGKVAGWNMAGRDSRYEGLFAMNSVELAGIPTISFGITNPPEDSDYEVLLKKDERNGLYRKVVLKDGHIVGAIFLGKIERAGIFTGLIRYGVDVSSFKDELLSDQFGFLVLPAEYRKHMVTGEGIEV